MNYGNKNTDLRQAAFAAADACIGRDLQGNGQSARCSGEVRQGRRIGMVPVAGRAKGIHVRGLFRIGLSRRAARAGNAIHQPDRVGESVRLTGARITHAVTALLVLSMTVPPAFGMCISPVILIPLGVTACCFLLVSWFRIMQSLTGCKDLGELIEKLKTKD